MDRCGPVTLCVTPTLPLPRLPGNYDGQGKKGGRVRGTEGGRMGEESLCVLVLIGAQDVVC